MSSQEPKKIVKNDDDDVDERQLILSEITKIMQRFEIISTLEGGYKLWLTVDDKGDKIFSIDTSYYVPSFITRYIGSQNRNDIVNTIIDDTNYINDHYSNIESKKGKNVVSKKIVEAIKGLKIMKETYKSTQIYADKLQSVITQLEKYVTQ